MHEQRERAGSFGAAAERYDRTRPHYPERLTLDLLECCDASRAPRVLDIGCGTGIASEFLRARGCDVLGVEADERMAAIARGHGLTVEIAPFESWDSAGRVFDLAVCGQAWHWIDPTVGPAKVAAVLRPGDGRFAAFWNRGRHEPALFDALIGVYERIAPALCEDSVALGTIYADRFPADADVLSPALVECEAWTFAWEQEYTTAQWLDLLPTFSDHHLLPPAQLAALLDGVAAVIDAQGGSILVEYQTNVITARRP